MKLLKRLLGAISGGAKPPPRGQVDELPFRGFNEGRVQTRHVESLSDEDLKLLNELLPWSCFTVDSHGRRFGNRAWSGKRAVPQLVPDPRIVRMEKHFSMAGKHVLEFGCFEGVHTAGLCQFAGRVTAIDSRIENVVKSVVRTSMFGYTPTVFVCNIEEEMELDRIPMADLAHHVGVLYHLRDPVAHLLSLGTRIREGLMLDTHVANPGSAKHEYEAAGRLYRYHRHIESGTREVFSGMYDHAKWLLLEDIAAVLQLAGFTDVEVVEQREERNGPRILLFARRSA